MKKEYEKANIEIIESKLDDVITTSGDGFTVDNWNPESEDTFNGGGIK